MAQLLPPYYPDFYDHYSPHDLSLCHLHMATSGKTQFLILYLSCHACCCAFPDQRDYGSPQTLLTVKCSDFKLHSHTCITSFPETSPFTPTFVRQLGVMVVSSWSMRSLGFSSPSMDTTTTTVDCEKSAMCVMILALFGKLQSGPVILNT